jgi:hypothetical protein
MPQVTATDGTPLHYKLHGRGLRSLVTASAELWPYTSIVGHAARVTQRVKVIAARAASSIIPNISGRPRSCHCHTQKWKSWTAAISFPLKSPPLLQAC